ncbi:MFS transporter [Kutzneria chonburiensis]|uniref:MFS transporter n=1 Tax=Kutzneria chonburiensis TaxID=1483604 RepID=A0ABV6MJ89_9PSEU|nr:MFS transporter [Kutzneria chonburiensis]
MDLGAGFRRLWWASATSDAGSAIGYGALPLVAVLILHASPAEVSLLAAVSALAGALIAVPSGAAVEFRRKRPVMVAADIVRFAALTSVAVTTALHVVTMAQLYAVSVIQTAALVTFQAASGAHLRSLVPTENRAATPASHALGHLGEFRPRATSSVVTLGGQARGRNSPARERDSRGSRKRHHQPERPRAARRSSPAGATCWAIGR